MHVNRVFVFDEVNHTITMKVWSPRENVQVLMKVEQQNGVLYYEIDEPTTKSGEWEEMTWDMSGAGQPDMKNDDYSIVHPEIRQY